MIDLPPCQIVAVFGPVASGKTYLLKQWLKTQSRVVAFDSTGEMTREPDFQECFASPRKLFDMIQTSPYYFRVAYTPGTDVRTDFSWCVKAMWQFDAVKLLAVDECHLVFPNNAIGDDTEMLLRFARHAKLGLICMSQRIADVHKLLTSSARTTVLFRIRDARDYDAISDRWGRDVAEHVRNLRPLIHDDSTGITKQVPQAVVITQTEGARVYDFATESYVSEPQDTCDIDEEENHNQSEHQESASGDLSRKDDDGLPEASSE